ncbi:MAG: hypothetical protein DCF20_15410 [Pseudanabaena sp.]|nr:MAG: hypothetical protein DCF20_15410 [Pseudanabaena sp.]
MIIIDIYFLPVDNLGITTVFLWKRWGYLGKTFAKMWITFNEYLYPVENQPVYPQGFPQVKNARSTIKLSFL